ncbi:substrate-binding domain-containing protein [Pseudoalteromonas sp. S16_S37]|uniref:substrate-binding domain-containing protein n=1 Tax=Pseudoalteromonas sp. S16_S37 TaxID=2720228 RepID=UPI0016804AEA|nr:substrate-binding domain-containing protein [Pseudoalteromonas sp. S16_S37]MBD1584304.1 sugar ABC transporter substrate-binding protein [Pseudoalteromonas sp. S16_S37]
MAIVKYTKLFLLVLSCVAWHVQAQLKIAVVGKTKNDSFYEQSFHGCEAFAKQHDGLNCIYDGADDYQDVRTQVLIVKELIDKGIDGLMISTTDSEYLVEGALKAAQQKGIPVVTFDSDLLPQHRAYRLAYVGTNNFDFGKALGEVAKKYKKEAIQSVCIQSGHQTTPNLNERIRGVRYALSNGKSDRLTAVSGWQEHIRCPLYTMGRRDDALSQLLNMIKLPKPPIFVAVAGFAQFSPSYIETLTPFKAKIADQTITIISADTENIQLQALSQGLSTENIGQNPYAMGQLSAQLLYEYITKKQRPEKPSYFLEYHYCTADNAQRCTVNH